MVAVAVGRRFSQRISARKRPLIAIADAWFLIWVGNISVATVN
jgi:hypothetical protein